MSTRSFSRRLCCRWPGASSDHRVEPPAVTELDAPRLLRRLAELAQRGAVSGGGITRPVYGTAWTSAQQLVSSWMRESGFLVRRDSIGNLYGRVEGSRGGRVVLIGSHLDTVPAGGALDGALGIVASIEALDALVKSRGRPVRIVEIVAIADHEGARFGIPALGARAIAGRLDPEESERYRDAAGTTLAEAARSAGLDPAAFRGAERLDIDAFLELHIEQGSILEQEPSSLGVASASTGAVLLEVVVGGRADSGNVPAALRRDALLGAATMVVALGDLARRENALIGVGEMTVVPGHAETVASRVRFLIDLRDAGAAARTELLARAKRVVTDVARANDLSCDLATLRDLAPRSHDPALIALLGQACRDVGATPREMIGPSVHDAAVLAPVARTGLLLVPSIDGRSHSPDEATAAADVILGARALCAAMERLLY